MQAQTLRCRSGQSLQHEPYSTIDCLACKASNRQVDSRTLSPGIMFLDSTSKSCLAMQGSSSNGKTDAVIVLAVFLGLALLIIAALTICCARRRR